MTTQYGGRMLGAVPMMGGTLMLTDRQLVFLPLIGRSDTIIAVTATGRCPLFLTALNAAGSSAW
ncbi:hypothetical protein [Amycolatopsis sp. RTGN1]|uniref:hypothetical protein n=1 Tax=Amycolatopsis ponsaeliensis TaxID=2992142 RepID=UPI00254B5FB9|nr:hypothetical protein [Amycolatopsis sp. RTGN1]